jgi:hypothetical protein
MAMKNVNKAVVAIVIGILGFIPVIPMVFYINNLLKNETLTWTVFVHTHWIGILGLIGLAIFFTGVLLCIYLTGKPDSKN